MTVALTLVRENGRVLSDPCVLADNPVSRFRGLMLRARLQAGESLFLATSAIQTTFMRFAIDVIFLDREMTVVKIRHRMRPWRLAVGRRAHAVVELEAGACERAGLEIGERLALVERKSLEGREEDGQVIRVAIGTRDRRFHRVASFLLSRSGFVVDGRGDPTDIADLVRAGKIDVVLLDASDSLVGAARTARTLEALRPEIGLVLAVNGETDGDHRTGQISTVPKWGSFQVVVDALEHSFAVARVDGLG